MRRDRGITILEVMMVVAIVGVIAALATVGLSGYMRHAKTAEATRSLGMIETASRQQYARPTMLTDEKFVHTFCPTGPLTPPAVPKARKIKIDPALWADPSWKCLMFTLPDPQFYSYRYVSNGLDGTSALYSASAYGDLDGDGMTSTYQLTGKGAANGEAERVSLTITHEDE
jgi:type IV pilus assembly protein PilA